MLLSSSLLYEKLAAVNHLIFAEHQQPPTSILMKEGALLMVRIASSNDREPLPLHIQERVNGILLEAPLESHTRHPSSHVETFCRLGEIIIKHDSPAVGLMGSMNQLLKARFLQDGWCPLEIRMLSQRFNATCQFNAAHLQRPGINRDHVDRGCTSMECMAYHTEAETYETRHVEGTCQCEHMPVDQDQIYDILKRGIVPAVEITTDPNEEPSLNVVETGPDVPYIALSHVWSDGLGNPRANSLPKCQLRCLSQWCKELDVQPQPIWIDTLCCPIGPGEAREAAIELMRKTYASASRVLVLDAWLKQHSTSTASVMETTMKYALCGWTRRLWTFQEGSINEEVSVCFADRIVDIDSMAQNIVFSEDLGALPMERTLRTYHDELRSLKLHQSDVRMKFRALTSCFKYRSTSVPTDEPLCLGVVFALDVSKIWRKLPGDRMATFWDTVQGIPADAIFWDALKLQQKGFRWAPSTLFGKKQNLCLTAIQKADVAPTRLTEAGLVVTLPGFLLQQDLAEVVAKNAPGKVDFQDQDANRYWFSRLTSEAYRASSDSSEAEDDLNWPAVMYSRRMITGGTSTELALIILGFPTESPMIALSPAILVTVGAKDSHTEHLNVEFVCYGLVCRMSLQQPCMYTAMHLHSQEWCVD